MGIVRKQIVALYVDRSNQQWVALDPDGNFWTLPGGDNSWDQRQPYRPTNEAELERLPGHYKYMLGIPT